MAKIQGFKRLIVEDFKEEDRDMVGKIGYAINTFAEEVSNAFNKSLTIEDNLNWTRKDISVQVDNKGVPIVPQVLASGLPAVCKGMLVISATNKDNFVDVNKTITANSAAPLTVITSVAHGLSSGDQIVISGSNSTPSINGRWHVAKIDANTFNIPLTVSVAGTAGNIFKSFSPSSTPFITFSDNGGQVTISKITNLEPNNVYNLKLILFN